MLATVTAPTPAAPAQTRTRIIRRRNHLRKDELSIFGVLVLVAFAILMFMPFIILFGRAFMTYDELFHFPPVIIPYALTTNNFATLILALSGLTVPFARYLFNSVLVVAAVVMGVVVIATVAAYPLSKHRKMPGHGFLWFMVIASIMYAGPATNVPRYLIIERLGLVNTYWALILPVVVSTFGLFLLKQFVDAIPDSIIEAARIDGASEWGILRAIIYPATQPAWAVLVLLTFTAVWNDVANPQLYIHNDALKTLPVAFATLQPAGNMVAFAGAQAAAGMVMALPPIIVFLVTQSKVIATMAYAGMGGM